MAQTNAEHVASVKAYEAKLRGQDLPECAEPTNSIQDAVAVVGDSASHVRQRFVAAAHLRDIVNAGAAGLIPMSQETLSSIDPATQSLINSDSAHERAQGVRLATATAAHNLSAAEAIDKATRLDQGQSTENVTLRPMKMPGARGVTPPRTEGGGDPDIGTLPAQPPISQKQVSAPRPDPST